MKLSNLSVIFIVIAIPLILILSYYISLQRDTINLQISYNTKLLESTKEAIEAFEINTVEWNEAYSETADSKRRDVMASINTFTTSLANNLGVSGTSKEYLLAHIPAVAFTLYDGCYIYSPSETKYTVKDKNGVTVFMNKEIAVETGYTNYDSDDDGKILYQVGPGKTSVGTYESTGFTLNPNDALSTKDNSQDYPYILKPFTAYSESVTNANGCKMVINYTLDNYVTIHGQEESTSEYISKSGYLNKISSYPSDEDNVIYIDSSNFTFKTLDGDITFSGQSVGPEILSETIAWKNGTDIETETFKYVYEAERDTKVYYDGEFFRLNKDLEKVYVKDLTEPLYKKLLIPAEIDGEQSYIKLYQNLDDKHWYMKDDITKKYIKIEAGDASTIDWYNKLSVAPFNEIRNDYSAINYCVETYVFTEWVNDLKLKYKEKEVNEFGTIVEKTGTSEITIKIDDDNDPEDEYSAFTKHKREVIKNTIISNLNQAITSYSKHSKDEYKLPKLQETEWDQVLSNVSIITFLQNIPIGLKYYNNYAIATSTFNKEFVDPNEIYLYDKTDSDFIYHSPYCKELDDTDDELIGYRSIDYMYKYYEEEDSATGDKSTKYYFKHENTANKATQSCYYCLVQRALYEKDETNYKKDAYYTALARERYLQLDSINITAVDIDVTKQVSSPNLVVDYGDELTYTITIANNGLINDTIYIYDDYDENMIENITVTSGEITKADGTVQNISTCDNNGNRMAWSGIHIGAGETITITYTAKVKNSIALGSNITNYVKVYSDSAESIILAETTAYTTIAKEVEVAQVERPGYNIVLVLDHSNSMSEQKLKNLYNGVNIFLKNDNIQNIFKEGNSQISVIKFWGSADIKSNEKRKTGLQGLEDLANIYNKDNVNSFLGIIDFDTRAGTFYNGALEKAKEELEGMSSVEPNNENMVLFFTDGMPTHKAGLIGFAIQENGNYELEFIGDIGSETVDFLDLGATIWTKGFNGIFGVRRI